MRPQLLRGLLPLLLVAGCQCDPFGVDTTRFTCTSQGDCIEGFECRDVGAGLECVKSGTGTDGGSDAGPFDAGDVDAGDVDAGDVDAGDVDAGDVDAGGSDAGGSDAGLDAGVDAGFDAGLPDAGGLDAGVGAVALRFSTAPQTIAVSACSQIITVESINGAGVPTSPGAAITVTVSSAPIGVSFWSVNTCAGPSRTTFTMNPGSSSTSLYGRASVANAYALTASSPSLTTGAQTLMVVNAPTSLVFTSTPPDPVRGGSCLSATVEARRTGVATPVINATSIGLSVSPGGGARFYSDAACTTSATSTTMAAGASTAGFFVKPLTGGANVITAAAPFGTANQPLNTTPIVQRGLCSFPAASLLSDGGTQSALTANCTLSPALTDLGAAFAITQATTVVTTSALGVAEVRCRLSSTTNLTCFRREDADPVDVHYQVAEVPQGLLAQRATSGSCPAIITLTTPVNLGRSFVLKALSNATGNFDDEDAAVLTLTSPTTLSLAPTTCQGHDTQVIDWNGITVTSGSVTGGMPTGVATVTVSGLPAASNDRALLIQPGTTLNGARPVCSTMIRGAMPSSSSIVLTRSAGDAGCTLQAMESVRYERIDFGGRGVVREYTVPFAPGQRSLPVTISPVDATRSVVFASSQIAAGQGAGETDYAGVALFTEAAFQLVLTNSTTVTATRAESTSAAIVTFYVAELLP